MNRDQRRLLIKMLVDNKPLRIAAEAELGLDRAPTTMADFDSKAPDVCDKCEGFLRHVIETCSAMREEIVKRPRDPRQPEFDFDAGEKEQKRASKERKDAAAASKKLKADAEKKERRKVAGNKEGRKAAVAALTGGQAAKKKKTGAKITSISRSKKKVTRKGK